MSYARSRYTLFSDQEYRLLLTSFLACYPYAHLRQTLRQWICAAIPLANKSPQLRIVRHAQKGREKILVAVAVDEEGVETNDGTDACCQETQSVWKEEVKAVVDIGDRPGLHCHRDITCLCRAFAFRVGLEEACGLKLRAGGGTYMKLSSLSRLRVKF